MLLEQIKNELTEAMKAKDETKVSTLRFLLAQIQNKTIALRQAQGESLSDEQVIEVIQKQAKERRESIEAFKQGRREDLVGKEQSELDILNKYLPQQISEDELRKIVQETVTEVGAISPADFGKVMGVVMVKVKGKAEGKKVTEVVKEALSLI